MFDSVINLISLLGFDNLGIVYELDKLFYSQNDNRIIAIEDNKREYFFALKGKSNVDYSKMESCGAQVTQNYTFKFVTKCPMSFWLFSQLNYPGLSETDNINDPKAYINSMTENKVTDTLFLTEIDMTFIGVVNDCEVIRPCCC